MAARYYLEMTEDGHRIPKGISIGYETLDEAIEQAKRYLDDALPNNDVHVLKRIGTASLFQDGSSTFRETI